MHPEDQSASFPEPRPEVQRLRPAVHGGPDYAELCRLGLSPGDVLDFSASTNAYGPPPGVVEAMAMADVTRYPDRHAIALREAIAEREGVSCAEVLVGNGAAQLIWLVAMAYLRPGDVAFVVGPTFGEYRVAAQLMGAHVVEWRADESSDFVPDLSALEVALKESGPRLVWLCNPNNPTGVYLGAEAVARLHAAALGALWVIDEAYRPFVADAWPSVHLIAKGGVVLLRSLTKDHALPGVRLGYALAAPSVIEALARVQPPWSVSAMAQAAGLVALQDRRHVAHTIGILRAEAAALRDALRAQGWRVVPSATHFCLVEVGDARIVRDRLLREHRIQVRDCTSFGLPRFVRVAARRPEENERLLSAMEALRCRPGR